jgi:hypothetical protein
MEYPSKNDFFIRFKALINERGRFLDYVLVEVSDNFYFATGMNSDRVLGEKLSSMVIEMENPILGFKNFHYHMLPRTRRKFEHYIEEEDRWYLVTLYSDERDYLMMVYTDISRYTEGLKDIKSLKKDNKGVNVLEKDNRISS